MTLFTATCTVGLFLILIGAWFYKYGPKACALITSKLRHPVAILGAFGSGMCWFMYHIAHLGPADFGDHKGILLILFGGMAVVSYFKANELLSVRGLAILIFLSAHKLLQAAYFQEPKARLILVSFVYVSIICGMIIGAAPYLFRDLINWMGRKRSRTLRAGGGLIAYGSLLLISAFTCY